MRTGCVNSRRKRRRGSASARPAARSSSAPSCGRRRCLQTEISLRWLEAQIHALKRPDDRALFGLDSEPSADAAGADKTEPAGAPITSRQKKLLAELVEEHPRLARELGVNPDEPGLEKLDKAKAGLLIRAVLDRVNPQAPPDEQ